MRVAAPDVVDFFLQEERRIKLGSSGDNQLRCRARVQQFRARSDSGQRLTRAAVSAKDIVGGDASAAETAEDHLGLNRLAAQLIH